MILEAKIIGKSSQNEAKMASTINQKTRGVFYRFWCPFGPLFLTPILPETPLDYTKTVLEHEKNTYIRTGDVLGHFFIDLERALGVPDGHFGSFGLNIVPFGNPWAHSWGGQRREISGADRLIGSH